jgi:uncharacterized protein
MNTNLLPLKFENQNIYKLYNNIITNCRIDPDHKHELLEIVLLITSTCNLRCTYCYANFGDYHSNNRTFMPMDTAIQTLGLVTEKYKGIERIKIFGGEPTLNLRVIENICKYVKNRLRKNPPQIGIVTNLITIPDGFLKLIQKYHLNVTVSCDGPPEINDRLRMFPNGKGTFKTIWGNIEKVKRTGQTISIEAVYTPIHFINGLSVKDVVHFFMDKGIDDIIIHPVANYQNFFEKISRDGVSDFIANIRGLYKEYIWGELINIGAHKKCNLEMIKFLLNRLQSAYRYLFHCCLGNQSITIDCNGSVWPCYKLNGYGKFNMGSVFDRSLFNRKKYLAIKKLFVGNTKSKNNICSSCDIKEVCSACPGDMVAINKSMKTPMKLFCDYQMGSYEGLLYGLIHLWQDKSKWTKLERTISLN